MAHEHRLFLEPLDYRAREKLRDLIHVFKGDDPLAPVTIVVPSTYAGLDLRRELGRTGSANVHLLSLGRLAELLGAPSLAGQKLRPLTPILEAAAVRAASDLARDSLEPVRQHPALHTTLRSTFRDLRHATEDGIAKISEQSELRTEVIRLYRSFRENTSGRYYDRESLAQSAAEAIMDGTTSALKDLGPVVLFLVSHITPGEQELIESLARKWSCAVILGLTGDDEADNPVRALAGRLATQLGLPEEGTKPEVPSAGQLAITPDPQQEIRWVVRHIVRSAQEGTPFHRIAILYRQSTPYVSLIQEELSFSEVPMAGPGYASLGETAGGRLLLGIIRLVGTGLRRSEVMEWITSSPILAPGAPGTEIPSSRWDAISRRAGVVGGVNEWQRRLDHFAGETERMADERLQREEISEARAIRMQEEASVIRSLSSFIEDLAARILPPQENAGWVDFAHWAQGLMTAYLNRSIANSQKNEESALQKIENILTDMETLDEVEPLPSFERFRSALEEALLSPVGHLGETGRGVFVAPFEAALGMNFDLVFGVGLIEGSVPPRQSDDPLLPDQQRQQAGGADAGISLRGDRQSAERYQYLAALASGNRCVLSFPRGNAGAQRGQFPARWFLESASRLSGDPVYTSNLWSLGSVPWLSVVASTEDGLNTVDSESPASIHDRDLHHIWRWRQTGKLFEDHHLADSNQLLGAINLEKHREKAELTQWDGDVSLLKDKSRRLQISNQSGLSPTSLETWATCPFRYFVSRVLGVSALEEPEEVATISPLEKGSLVHIILEGFIKEVLRVGTTPAPGDPWSQEQRDLLHQLAEQAFSDAESRGVTGKALLWEMEREAIKSDLDAFLEADTKLRAKFGVTPHFVEARFGIQRTSGDEQELDAAEREIAGIGNLRFRGIVDRVDLDPSGRVALVLDYKTGGVGSYRAMRDDPVDAGRRLQLSIYTLALQKYLGESVTVRAAYWFISSRGKFTIVPQEPIEFSQVEEKFDQAIGTITRGISNGLFPANPGPDGRWGPANCSWCDFDTLCPSRRDVHWNRNQSDPRLQDYVSLQIAQGPSSEAADA